MSQIEFTADELKLIRKLARMRTDRLMHDGCEQTHSIELDRIKRVIDKANRLSCELIDQKT